VIGFGFSAFERFYPQLKYLTIHAFTIGVIGVLTLGMISRVSLGHTGRNINNPPKLCFYGFLIVSIAALIRILALLFFPNLYREIIITSGLLWSLAFLLFLVSYFNFLIQPRADSVSKS
jgi:uncharacterized protein involved in response to NO